MIAFLINELDIRGGTHKQFLKLIEYVDRHTDDYIIITKKVDFEKTYPGFKNFENKIRIFNVSYSGGRIISLLKNMINLRDLIKDVSVINIHGNGFEQLFPALKNKKVIWQVNDLPSIFGTGVSKNIKPSLHHIFLRIYIRISAYVVNYFTVNVSKNKERIKKCFGRNALVFYCGIESVNIVKNINESILRFTNKQINILTSGVFFPYRNYETQIKVVNELRKYGIDAKLKIIGSTQLNPNYANNIQFLINKYNLNKSIEICGQVDESTFNQLHADADIFIFINIDQSWGLAVFEAMSCGLPVIVSNSVGATEILHDNQDSIFVNPTDTSDIVNKILTLISNPYYYKNISSNAKQLCEQFTWDKTYCTPMFTLLSRYII